MLILTGYVVNFNRRHRRYGHLFQNRYKSIVCQEYVYLKELVRYIHLNLLRAGLVKNLKELNRNPWSGHSALVGKVERKWQNIEYVLSFFGDAGNSRKNYSLYVENGIDQGSRPELVGGGLIRSMGGWSAVLASRRRGERDVAGQRIDIKVLARKVSGRYNVSTCELRSGGRRRAVVKARRVMSWIGVRELGYSGADIARYLGVTNSCVTRMISTGSKPDLDDINIEL